MSNWNTGKLFQSGKKNLQVNADYSSRVSMSLAIMTIKIFYVTEKKTLGGNFNKRKKVKKKGRNYTFSIYIKGLHGKVVLTFRHHAKCPAW